MYLSVSQSMGHPAVISVASTRSVPFRNVVSSTRFPSTRTGACSTSGRVGDMYIHGEEARRLEPFARTTRELDASMETFLDHPRSGATSPSSSPSLSKHRAVVSVCKNKHCCRRGANALYVRLAEEARGRRDSDIDVRASGCLKHCKRGPACHVSVVSDGGEEGVIVREVICVHVGGEHDVADLAAAYTLVGGSAE